MKTLKTRQILSRFFFSLLMIAVMILSACSIAPKTGSQPSHTDQGSTLSAEYDFILCEGTDISGANYQLVAKQTESAKGSSLSMGVIKNSSWISPLSETFPFITAVLEEGETIGNLSENWALNSVIEHMWFIDSGAFLCQYKINPESIYSHDGVIIFSCSSQKTLKIDEFDDIVNGNAFFGTHTVNNFIEADFSNERVTRYGKIFTADGLLTLVESHKNGVYLDDRTFDAYLLDLSNLNKTYLMKDSDFSLAGPFSEGLVLRSDNKFYTKDGAVAIDLESLGYLKIDSLEAGRFIDGEYSFIVVNDVGSKYQITIDKSGNVLSEQKR